MSERPSRAGSVAGSRAGSVAGSRAGSVAGSRAGSVAGSRAGSGGSSAAGSAANSGGSSAASSPGNSRPGSRAGGDAGTVHASASASAAGSVAGSAAGSAATSAATSNAASKAQSGATSRDLSRSSSRAISPAKSAAAPKPKKAAAKPKTPEVAPETFLPKKKLKSRSQWEKEQRERLLQDEEYIARQQHERQRMQELVARIEICDVEYARLKAEGSAIEALQWLERGMWVRRDRYGVASEEVQRSAQTLCGDCNTVAMAALQAKDLVLSRELLQKALLLTEPVGSAQGSGVVRLEGPRSRLRAVTYNNLGCYYRKRRKLHTALQMLDKALRLELLSDHVDTPATTHLNMSVVLSQLQKHRAASEHADCAIELLKKSSDPRGISGLVQALDKKPPGLLALAYHTMATQLEFLHEEGAALKMYEQAADTAARSWGAEHGKALKMQQDYRAAHRRAYPEEYEAEEEKQRKALAKQQRQQALEDDDDDRDLGTPSRAERPGKDSKDRAQGGKVGDKSKAGQRTKLPALAKPAHGGGSSPTAKADGRQGRQGKQNAFAAKRRSLKSVMLSEEGVSPDSSPERNARRRGAGERRSGLGDGAGDEAGDVQVLPVSPGSAAEHAAGERGGKRRQLSAAHSPVDVQKQAQRWAAHQVPHRPSKRLPPLHGMAGVGGEEGGGKQWVAHFAGAAHVGAKDEELMEEEWAEAEESLGRLEARMKEFIRQLDTGHLQNRAARKLTNDAGEEVVRCRCLGSFGRQMMLVPLGVSLPRLMAQINKEVDMGVEAGVDAEIEVFYIDTDGDLIDIRSDAALKSTISDARARADETLSLKVVTRLDREREAAAAAAAAAQKEKEEADAAEAAARRELEEAEEAERVAQEARAAAMAAHAAHSKEELEALEAERIAEELRKVRQGALAGVAEATKQVQHLHALLEQHQAQGDEAAADLVRAQLAEAEQAQAEAAEALKQAQQEHAAAAQDAERERREADEARRKLESERANAEELERVAAKERAEAEEAAQMAQKEREEYEAAQQSAERSQAELQRSLDTMASHQGNAAAAVDPEELERQEEQARAEREERDRQREEEARQRGRRNAAQLVQCNLRMQQARKKVRYRSNLRNMKQRRDAATKIQRMVRLWGKAREMRQMARQKVLAHKAAHALVLQRAVRMWRARGAVHVLRLESCRAGLLLGRYRVCRDLPPLDLGAQDMLPAAKPEPPGGAAGLPVVATGSSGYHRKEQEEAVVEAINWRFIGRNDPPPAPEVGRLGSAVSSVSRLASTGQPHRPPPSLQLKKRDKRRLHPDMAALLRAGTDEWLMWGVDCKRPASHSLRRVMLRFCLSPERHVKEVARLRSLAGEDELGRSWRSCRTDELKESDVHAVSLALDASMFLAGPGAHVIVQPAPEMLLHTKLEDLGSQGLTQETVQVLQQLTVAVDLVHSRDLVMLASLNERGSSSPLPLLASSPPLLLSSLSSLLSLVRVRVSLYRQ